MLTVCRVYKSYGGGMFGSCRSQILKNITFNIEQGECAALIGESGCGKSTLARLILGLEACDSGQITCAGITVTSRPRHRKALYRTMQPVFQDSAGCLNPRMKVRGSICEPLRNFAALSAREEQRELEKLLTLVELPLNVLDKYPHELSGGQQKRVCIARAISIKPQFLILDEAVSGIDATITKTILELLKKMQRKVGCGYLFITHDLQIALYMAQKILVMRGGQIVEMVQGAVSAKDFATPYSKQLFKSSTLDCLRK
ncbi:MAG: dipeptide/oligopeptide/nickel ABC transporter ATP-binding protein [Clostridiaceae bacterium]|jgi:ABC-type dipeptide/oligopeptide/nickel transport system ATPase subunit|nr:dipeptide/oligopeptide/nickel ABC transporter ATP-binding protein [Clostridiaceae bacterium]